MLPQNGSLAARKSYQKILPQNGSLAARKSYQKILPQNGSLAARKSYQKILPQNGSLAAIKSYQKILPQNGSLAARKSYKKILPQNGSLENLTKSFLFVLEVFPSRFPLFFGQLFVGLVFKEGVVLVVANYPLLVPHDELRKQMILQIVTFSNKLFLKIKSLKKNRCHTL